MREHAIKSAAFPFPVDVSYGLAAVSHIANADHDAKVQLRLYRLTYTLNIPKTNPLFTRATTLQVFWDALATMGTLGCS